MYSQCISKIVLWYTEKITSKPYVLRYFTIFIQRVKIVLMEYRESKQFGN